MEKNEFISKSGKDVEVIYDNLLAVDTDLIFALKKSERNAWRVCAVFAILTILALTTVAILTPFYRVELRTFEVDKLTGEAQLVSMDAPLKIKITEAQDKHWVAEYVTHRERYFWTLLSSDYEYVINQSSPEIANSYAAIYKGQNSRDKRLGSNVEQRIQITGITLPPSQPGVALVRFERLSRRLGQEEPKEKFMVTIRYAYNPPKAFDRAKNVIDNPEGFRVTGYAVDMDYAAETVPAMTDPKPNTDSNPGTGGSPQ